jgi:hypothetical protein
LSAHSWQVSNGAWVASARSLLYAVQSFMKRRLSALAAATALLGCGPGASPQRCEGKADFVVSLTSPTDTFPNDTQIEVTFGGGSTEAYRLTGVNDPEVLFCEINSAPGPGGNEGGAGGTASSMQDIAGGAGAGGTPSTGGWGHGGAPASMTGGASGASDGRAIHSITCEVWSGGPATITIRAASWRTTRELQADSEHCTSSEDIVLGEPEPKP